MVRLATLAQECGLDGVVASARESSDILEACGPDFVLGVRLSPERFDIRLGERVFARRDVLVAATVRKETERTKRHWLKTYVVVTDVCAFRPWRLARRDRLG